MLARLGGVAYDGGGENGKVGAASFTASRLISWLGFRREIFSLDCGSEDSYLLGFSLSLSVEHAGGNVMQRVIKSKAVQNVVRIVKDRQDVVGCAIWLQTCLASLRAHLTTHSHAGQSLSPFMWMQAMAAAAFASPAAQLATASSRGERRPYSPRRATAPVRS